MLGRLLLGHSWYSNRCCHDMDCYPADEAGRLPEGTLVLSRGNIRMRVPRSRSVSTANLTSVAGKPAGDSSAPPLVSARYLVAHARPYLFRKKQCK
jgi:hypothetical protein